MPTKHHTHGGRNGDANERTPLVSTSDNGNGHNHEHSPTYKFFLDTQETPGLGSQKPWVKWPAHVWHTTKTTLLSSYVNILLVFVPIGIVAGVTKWDPVTVFILNFLAIIPLAAVLSFATEEISVNLGDALGGLLNATFGNAVELIVSIIALMAEEYDVVKSSMIGSILSNLLLVMGMCFLFGGIANMRDQNGVGMEQTFASITAQTTCSLMTLAAASMIIPGALSMVLNSTEGDEAVRERTIINLSRGTAIILLLIYVLYLWFQLRTHHNLFSADSQEAEEADESQVNGVEPESRESEVAEHMSPWSAAVVLIVVTVMVSVCADYLVNSIDALVERAHISRNFVGLILIPIVGNAAEHVTAVVVAIKNKMDLAMGVAIGSSIQIALFVTPFLVVLGWVIDLPMTLKFETFETVAFALSVLVVTYTVQDGKSNYLEGAMLMSLYIIIAVAFFVTPSESFGKSN
ncbi:Sodium/calcium exchanger protein-domain-containing protein [Pseudomassariella vexata]|uniref:Vacuolar calcium ion transporter n=1 Tax=Pseudomassariella vexata TaxID=1141098 RepID=A0A1Y2DTH0_9PEZI|nr:Sodium/calcium exchanger protein-domain-containing protein [Pseudomassariella vexata]ORY62573.1 Sodium/calcium exchanger protein-domain-containing protein [Pseudomassariella vexata]